MLDTRTFLVKSDLIFSGKKINNTINVKVIVKVTTFKRYIYEKQQNL